MENISTILNIDFVEHLGYFIPRSVVEGFDPETYFDGPVLDINGLCYDDECQKMGKCKDGNSHKQEKA